jgi:hypothetical protein
MAFALEQETHQLQCALLLHILVDEGEKIHMAIIRGKNA